VLAVPRFALSIGLGEFGRSSVLGGQQALPAKLTASGFRFTHTDLASALRAALGRD
jgi:NAD dependent epimerase/dehydratase family enzyme